MDIVNDVLRTSADSWWSEYDRELKAHEAMKAEIVRLTAIGQAVARGATARIETLTSERDAALAEVETLYAALEVSLSSRDALDDETARLRADIAEVRSENSVYRDDIVRARRERDAARAALDRVRALDRYDPPPPPGMVSIADLRAALDPEEPR